MQPRQVAGNRQRPLGVAAFPPSPTSIRTRSRGDPWGFLAELIFGVPVGLSL